MLGLFAAVEIAGLVWVAATTSFFLVLGIVFLTAMVGTSVARSQGTAVLEKGIEDLSRGTPPTTLLLEGMLILLGGILLVMPGLIADCVGLTLMIPLCRKWYVRGAQRLFSKRTRGPATVFSHDPRDDHGGVDYANDVIDVEFREEK